MALDLINDWEKLKLTEDEDRVIGDDDTGDTVVDVKISLILFYNVADKQRVLEGCPWSFDNQLLLLKEVSEKMNGDSLCLSKQCGGLGFRDVFAWNIACLGKYVWAIASKQDNVWIKLIQSVYVKGENWWSYIPKGGVSWYWKRICKIKEDLKRHYTEAEMSSWPKYSIQDVYDTIKGDKQKVPWDKMVWNRLSVPKHRFISWLTVQSKLQTTVKLAQIGISTSDRCLICHNGTEDHVHLFFQCQYSEKCFWDLKRWLGITTTRSTLHDLIRWLKRTKQSKFVKQVYYAGLAALIYSVWQARNNSYWNAYIPSVEAAGKQIRAIVKLRIDTVIPQKISRRDMTWFSSL
ncbi:uncharacterized protein LOC125494873 [Beta vulgaris subsp. vulgaris]|uniref:uncharacterized protein LOC125494873 n=1 Tax=Beta vulgaris subsp. vulgaris TaxID=3555 RepID=UPI002037615B|nr:uncharacterized protein LOC125494873 [Beta vulgaris subsp. vulgaris]